MSNHYELCLNEINDYLKEGLEEKALELIKKELAMPYVPEPYFTQFNNYLNEIVIDQRPHSQYFDTVQEIETALKGNQTLQQKGIVSLERMNLRSELEWCETILLTQDIQDWIKKQILLFMMEQEIKGQYQVLLQDKIEVIDMEQLIHPLATQTYQICYQGLQEELESDNPSMFMLCVGELEYLMLEVFPFESEGLKAHDIITRVQAYF